MKRIFFLIIICLPLILGACGEHIQGNGNVTERSQELGHFKSIDISGVFEVQLIPGKEAIYVITDDNLHEHINIKVEDGELRIDTKDKFLDAEQLVLRIHYQELNDLDVSGAVNLNTESAIKSDRFQLDVSGVCDGEIEVSVDELEIEISGGGELILSGKADNTEIDISGAGEINALDLNSMNASLNITGAGEIELTVSHQLDISITGAGEVRYSGDPEITQKITGAGEISQIH